VGYVVAATVVALAVLVTIGARRPRRQIRESDETYDPTEPPTWRYEWQDDE
jgi:hypothetical protein